MLRISDGMIFLSITKCVGNYQRKIPLHPDPVHQARSLGLGKGHEMFFLPATDAVCFRKTQYIIWFICAWCCNSASWSTLFVRISPLYWSMQSLCRSITLQNRKCRELTSPSYVLLCSYPWRHGRDNTTEKITRWCVYYLLNYLLVWIGTKFCLLFPGRMDRSYVRMFCFM
jgi:hypothetical protein